MQGISMTSGYSGASLPGDQDRFDILAGLQAGVAEYISSLRELGIDIRENVGEIQIDLDERRLKIGHVTHQGEWVVVRPRIGVTLWQIGDLIMQAQAAKTSQPDPEVGWRDVAGLGWSLAVYQPLP